MASRGLEGVRGVCMVWGGVEVVPTFSLEVTQLFRKKSVAQLETRGNAILFSVHL